MQRRLGLLATVLACLAAAVSLGQDVRHEIQFPNLPGTQTLKCDLHLHTVFSDGSVWPPVRVQEAWRQGLDAISITDHIEYQPHKEDVPTHHVRPFDLAAGAARAQNLLLVPGAEITRDTPPGHYNALFLTDISRLDTKDFLEAIEAANAQQAFVFWNHHGWKGPEKGQWLDVQTTMYEKKWLRGMEVCNGDEYYPDAHQWCLDKQLTMFGNTDSHDPDLRKRSAPDDHRTMTLVLAKERTLEGLKEALLQGRTFVWFEKQLIGREELLRPFFQACLQVADPHYRGKDYVLVEARNTCDVDIQMERKGDAGPAQLTLPARTVSLLKISVRNPKDPVELKYVVTNFLIAPASGLPVTLRIPGL